MSARENAPLGSPCWVDLMSGDAERARAFYGELLGWGCEDGDPQFGGYANFTKDGKWIAGLMPKMEEGLPDVWSVYLEVDDAEAAVARAKEKGGQVFAGPMAVADLGVMVVAADSAGAMIGMWQPGEHPGFSTWMEPGAPGWFELHTRDLDGSIGFYQDVFGWETRVESDTPEFRYVTEVQGELQYAGVMDASGFLPEGVPNHWSVYFDVADIDASCALVEKLGGSVVMAPEDTPYGRLATLTDPMGAMFKLHQDLPQS
jgi:predicted enzyme related to lactoylglutathione lyase